MAVQEREIRIDRGPGPRWDGGAREEPPIGELIKDLTNDASTLVRQEVALAKVELRETAKQLGRDAVKLGAAAVFAWFGAMAGVAFLILGLGALLDSYWLSALIVAVVFLAIGAILAKNAKNDMQKAEMKPVRTMETLQEDKAWAKREIRDFKQDMRRR